jgi:Resolvase, N terminal domain
VQTHAAKVIPRAEDRPTHVRYWVVVFAVTLAIFSYIDRVALARAAGTISKELGLNKELMGWVFLAFRRGAGTPRETDGSRAASRDRCGVGIAAGRMGRSLADLVVTLNELNELGVGFVSLNEALDLRTPTGRAMASLLSVFAEFEHAILCERVRAGLAEARLATGSACNGCEEGSRDSSTPSRRRQQSRDRAAAAHRFAGYWKPSDEEDRQRSCS